MKRKTLTTAIVAGLTGVAGMVSVANAVNVNPDGLGQALIYPYYTARGGNDTLISVVNTSSQAKVAKVRFLEGLNSREVLDFNLYLSAFDVWTAAVTASGDGAQMVTADSSCTVPYIFGNGGVQDLLTFEFTGDKEDGGPTGAERTASGYLEIIDMGTVIGDTPDGDGGFTDAQTGAVSTWGSEFALTHVPVFEEDENGDDVPVLDDQGIQIRRPRNCQQLVDAWSRVSIGTNPPAFYWTNTAGAEDVLPSAGGELFGAASIINVNEGTMFAYNAVAIDNWTTARLHNVPGNVEPSLLSGGQTESNVFVSEGGAGVTADTWADTLGAVDAVLTHDRIMNEYNINRPVSAATEWVLTYPTKRFHVDVAGGFGGTEVVGTDPDTGEPIEEDIATAPFSFVFDGESCEPLGFNFWDREERAVSEEVGIIVPIVSPEPPPDEVELTIFENCFEANVIRFANADETVPAESEILGEPRFTTFPLPEEFRSGWMRIGFDLTLLSEQLGEPDLATLKSDLGLRPEAREQVANDGTVYYGLPVTGFGVTTFSNNTLEVDGNTVLSNYGGTFAHRGTRRIEDQ